MSGYGWSRDYVLFQLPEVEGRTYCNWLVESNPWGNVDRDSEGYLAQEIEKLLK
jgi:hypothetical protein